MTQRKILINYAHRKYYRAQEESTESALKLGGFTNAINFRSQDISSDFYKKNKSILKQKRGAGYWLWKFHLILKTLEKAKSSDLIFYCDSGADFIRSFNDYLFDLCNNDEKGLILFKMLHPRLRNSFWTKRDCFHYMSCDSSEYTETNQISAALILLRKNNFTLNFFKEALSYGEDSRIITDQANTCGKENYPGFQDHRHDQSILTNLQIKHNVTCIKDISQYGNPYGTISDKDLLKVENIEKEEAQSILNQLREKNIIHEYGKVIPCKSDKTNELKNYQTLKEATESLKILGTREIQKKKKSEILHCLEFESRFNNSNRFPSHIGEGGYKQLINHHRKSDDNFFDFLFPPKKYNFKNFH